MPNSLGSTLIWRRSAARMVSCVMGTSYVLPVRLSVMVSVSRGVEEPSCFLVVGAESEESIEKPSEAAAQSRAFLITVHQRRCRRKLVEGALSWPKECARVNKFRELREVRGHPARQYTPLDNCRYNEYYLLARMTREVGHDGYPQK